MVHNNDPAKDISITLNCKISMSGTGDDHFAVLSGIGMLSDFMMASNDSYELYSVEDNMGAHKFSHPQVKIKINFGMVAEYDANKPMIKLVEVDFMQSKIKIDYSANRITISNIENLLIYFGHFSIEGCGCSYCEGVVSNLVTILSRELQNFEETLLDDNGSNEFDSIYRDADNNLIISYTDKFGGLYADTYRTYKQNPMQLLRSSFLLKFINVLIFGTFENIIGDLTQARYIEPFRDMPRRDHVYTFIDNNLQLINSWLGANGFDTGLYFDNERHYAVSLTNQEFSELKKLNKQDLINKIYIANHQQVLKRIGSNQKISLSDVGFGISQLLPIIDVYTKNIDVNYPGYSYVFVEQPELHLHPRMQTVLADLIISWFHKMSQDKASRIYGTEHKTMIETHSEHLILRLLKRIRQTTDNELPEGSLPLTPEDVAVLYIQPGNNGTEVIPIPITPNGEFGRPWPQGFFAERAKELY
jgi:hypothetical protein